MKGVGIWYRANSQIHVNVYVCEHKQVGGGVEDLSEKEMISILSQIYRNI